jgi:hypothetical protein
MVVLALLIRVVAVVVEHGKMESMLALLVVLAKQLFFMQVRNEALAAQ